MVENPGTITGYRKRAMELRAEAAAMTNADTKKMMLLVAANYEQLANSLDPMARKSKL